MKRKRTYPMKPGDYQIGYGKPPPEVAIQEGYKRQSIWSKKKAPAISDKIAKALSGRQTVSIGGQSVSLTTDELFIKSILQHAIRGKNAKAMEIVLQWIIEAEALRISEAKRAEETRTPRVSMESLKGKTQEELTRLYQETLERYEKE